jgi:hypothetical protein
VSTKPRRGIRLPATPPTTAIPSPATHLALGSIRRDPGIQQRVGIAPALVDDYAETIADWIERAPVVVFDDGEPGYWLADGFHRVAAAERSGLDTIPAAVRQGTRRDAMLFAVGANRMQGQRPTRADKRRAVETLLADPEWSAWSDRRIADEAGVSPTTVGNIRREVEVSSLDTCDQAPTDVAGGIRSETEAGASDFRREVEVSSFDTCDQVPTDVAGGRADAPPPGDAPKPPTRTGMDGKTYTVKAKAPGKFGYLKTHRSQARHLRGLAEQIRSQCSEYSSVPPAAVLERVRALQASAEKLSRSLAKLLEEPGRDEDLDALLGASLQEVRP